MLNGRAEVNAHDTKENNEVKTITVAVLLLYSAAHGQVTIPNELSLDDAVAIAVQNNPEIQAAAAAVAEARANKGVANSKLLPQLSANGFASYGNTNNMIRSAGVEPMAMQMAPPGKFFDANLMLMSPLYTGGLLSAQVAAAAAVEKASMAQFDEIRADVIFRVQTAYLVSLLQSQLAVAQQSKLEAAQQMVKNVSALVEAGKAIEATLRRAEAEAADAKRQLVQYENSAIEAVFDLLAEMGVSMETLPKLAAQIQFTPPSKTLDEYLKSAARARGLLRAERQKQAAAREQLHSAKASTSPQIYGFAMSDAFLPKDVTGRSSGYTVGIVLSTPIFDGGMRRSEIARASAAYERAKTNVRQTDLQVEKEVRKAWLEILTAEEQYKTSQAALAAAEEAYNVTAIRVESGKGILLEQLDALAALTRARANLSTAAFEHSIAVLRIKRAAGEL